MKFTGGADPQHRVLEQAQRHERLGGVALAPHERDDAHHEQEQETTRLGRHPVDVLAAGGRQHDQRRQRDGEQRRTEVVDRVLAPAGTAGATAGRGSRRRAIANGTLMKNAQRQLRWSTNNPPTSGPTTTATANSMPW